MISLHMVFVVFIQIFQYLNAYCWSRFRLVSSPLAWASDSVFLYDALGFGHDSVKDRNNFFSSLVIFFSSLLCDFC